MPYFKHNGNELYYEVHGQGKPLIILNGIMMSHVSWQPFLKDLEAYQVILFDFYDQGQSHKMTKSYHHDLQVEALHTLVVHLNLKEVNVFGISYGAQIALQYAIKYPVEKLIIFNAALYTTPWLKDIGKAWQLAAETYNPELFFHVSIPYIYSHVFYTKHASWMNERKELLLDVFNKDFLDAMIRLIESSEDYDIRETAKKIKANTFIVGSEYDYITPADETKAIADQIKNSTFEVFYGCGHATMYEKSEPFIQCLKSYLG